jgi:hypothetical protein
MITGLNRACDRACDRAYSKACRRVSCGENFKWAEQMLKEASGGMLEVWSERVLTAAALDDVFAE